MQTSNLISSCAAVAIGLVFGPPPAAAQSINCRPVINSRCTITYRVDAGKASHTSQGIKVQENKHTTPSGFVFLSSREINDSGSSGGGTFNTDFAARGSIARLASNYSRESRRISDYRRRIDALYEGSRGSEKAKLDVLKKGIDDKSAAARTIATIDTNNDIITLKATSQYQCTRSVFGTCIDGRGGHGKGRVIATLLYVGNPSSKLNSIRDSLRTIETGRREEVIEGTELPRSRPRR